MIDAKLMSWWGGDKEVASAAWCSTVDDPLKIEARTDEDVKRVINQLISDNHNTPKEAVWLKFWISCPIFCERQLDKYRMTLQLQDIEITYLKGDFGRDNISQNEYSGRYKTLINEFIEMPDDVAEIWGMANEGSAQAVIDIKKIWHDEMTRVYDLYQSWLRMVWNAHKEYGMVNNAQYKRFREFVRGMIPTAYFTNFQWIMNMNAFEHIMNERMSEYSGKPQVETQIVARMMYEELKRYEVCPNMLKEMEIRNHW